MREEKGEETATRRAERLGLWVLAGFTAISVAGFATFGQHPHLLTNLSSASLRFYGHAFRFFAVGQVWLAFLLFAGVLATRTGLRWVPAFICLYLISLAAELGGTVMGVPFGSYSYSPLLAPMWFGQVPLIIPLSWFYMAVPSYLLATRALGRRGSAVARVGLASLLLASWDLALDPAMSYATRYWTWEASGPYYGMPWLNLFGWYVTGLALATALELLRASRWIARLPAAWIAAFYLVNLLLSLGMSAAAGLWGAVAATLLVLGSTAAGLRGLSRIGAGVGSSDRSRATPDLARR